MNKITSSINMTERRGNPVSILRLAKVSNLKPQIISNLRSAALLNIVFKLIKDQ